MERDRREHDDRAREWRVEDDRWGDSERNWINRARDRGKRDERGEEPGYDLDRQDARSRDRVRNTMLPRDARRDPWSGPPVQDVRPLPSGYYAREPDTRDAERAERGHYFSHPADEYSGGEFGVVHRERAAGGPGDARFGREDEFGPELATEAYGFESPAARSDADRFTYAGRGPRNYRRGDDRIAEEINEHFAAHGYLDATDVEVRVDEGEVTLTGAVASKREKRLAEDVAASVRGVADVRNSLRVR